MRCLFVSLLLLPQLAFAQASRTWVSGVGDDANPCSRTAPCATFAGAFANTATYGEINALDAGAFSPSGPVTLDRAVTLVGGANPSAIAGVVITATGPVTLRNLTIAGASGQVAGVDVQAAAKVLVQDCTIEGVSDGVLVDATGASVQLDGVRIMNVGTGIHMLSGPNRLMLREVVVSHAAVGLDLTSTSASIFESSFEVTQSAASASLSTIDLDQAWIRGAAFAFESTNDSLIRLSQVSAIEVAALTSIQSGGRVQSFGNNRVLGADGACLLPGQYVTPEGLPDGQVGSVYSAALGFTGGDGTIDFTVTSGALAAGLSLTNGVVGGTPSVEGTATFQVTGVDTRGCAAIRGYTINVAAAVPAEGPSGATGESGTTGTTGAPGAGDAPVPGDDIEPTTRAGCACGAGSAPGDLALAAGLLAVCWCRRRIRARGARRELDRISTPV